MPENAGLTIGHPAIPAVALNDCGIGQGRTVTELPGRGPLGLADFDLSGDRAAAIPAPGPGPGGIAVCRPRRGRIPRNPLSGRVGFRDRCYWRIPIEGHSAEIWSRTSLAVRGPSDRRRPKGLIVKFQTSPLERVMNCSRLFPGVFREEEAQNGPSEGVSLRKTLVFRQYSS